MLQIICNDDDTRPGSDQSSSASVSGNILNKKYLIEAEVASFNNSMGHRLVNHGTGKFFLNNLTPNSKYTVVLREKSGDLTRWDLDYTSTH